MKFIFTDGTVLYLRVIPRTNTIEAKLNGIKIRYERDVYELTKIDKTEHPKEEQILELIKQYFLPGRGKKNILNRGG